MFTDRLYENAERVGVVIRQSITAGYNIDVFKRNKDGEYIRIAHIGRSDRLFYEDLLAMERNGQIPYGVADERRERYLRDNGASVFIMDYYEREILWR